MERFSIAGLQVDMNCGDGILHDRSRAYLCDKKGDADFTVDIDDDFAAQMHEKYPTLTTDECHYVWSGECFYSKLLDFNGVLLHSSCIERNGYAYLFSAKSGTGKSTHTKLWAKVFGDVRMINDDKPAIRVINGTPYACGTPFSGKDDESENVSVPIRAIVFIERNEKNSIEKIEPAQAIPLFLGQTIRPYGKNYMVKMLGVLDTVLKSVPTFKLSCNMNDDAATTAFDGIENYYTQKEEQL